MGTEESLLGRFERATWPELNRLARDVLEAGIHFQGTQPHSSQHEQTLTSIIDTVLYNRKKDVGTPTGDWFKELVRKDAWFKDVVPNVGYSCRLLSLPLRVC